MGPTTEPLPFKLQWPSIFKDQSLVNGEWVAAASKARFEVIDPGTGGCWASAPDNCATDVAAAVEAAHEAFRLYGRTTPRARSQWLLKWGTLIEKHKDDLATIVTFETGKPLPESLAEVDYALSSTHWFAGEADRIQGTAFDAAIPGKKVLTIKQPIGVVAALVPWNFPVSMVVRKVGAALAAGCTMVIKPSPEAPLSALALAFLAEEAGIPKGVLNVLTTSLENTPGVSEALCRHPLVKKVTFTGSTRIGKLVARLCSEGLKKVTLELGGNCPFIIFDDANLTEAVNALMGLKWRNAGQACVTANRVYVHSAVYDEFASLITERTSRLVQGHGSLATSTIGPVTTPQALEHTKQLVEDAKAQGAKILLGGEQLKDTSGFFFQPTVIAEATKSMRFADEECFAPILSLFKFETEAQVIQAANDTSVGLASYVFTKDMDRSWRLMDALEAGMIGVNTNSIAGAEVPFGGIKESGYGKEAGKDVAVEEYLVTKAISVSVSRL